VSYRKASIERITERAEVRVVLDFEGEGRGSIQTGSPFLDHMLGLFARHGGVSLDVQCTSGHADSGILAEEIASGLGVALSQALGRSGEGNWFGYSYALVDEHLARAVIEISGQPGLVYLMHPPASALGSPESASVDAFWRAFTLRGRLNLSIELLHGNEGLPAYEAVFKAVARALKMAVLGVAGGA
jgi:imidazoleglycerol-phosphate dehydratase